MEEKPAGIPISKHHLSRFMIELCPHCNSRDLLVIDIGIAGYHPGGDWVGFDYKIFCNSCNTISKHWGHNRED